MASFPCAAAAAAAVLWEDDGDYVTNNTAACGMVGSFPDELSRNCTEKLRLKEPTSLQSHIFSVEMDEPALVIHAPHSSGRSTALGISTVHIMDGFRNGTAGLYLTRTSDRAARAASQHKKLSDGLDFVCKHAEEIDPESFAQVKQLESEQEHNRFVFSGTPQVMLKLLQTEVVPPSSVGLIAIDDFDEMTPEQRKVVTAISTLASGTIWHFVVLASVSDELRVTLSSLRARAACISMKPVGVPIHRVRHRYLVKDSFEQQLAALEEILEPIAAQATERASPLVLVYTNDIPSLTAAVSHLRSTGLAHVAVISPSTSRERAKLILTQATEKGEPTIVVTMASTAEKMGPLLASNAAGCHHVILLTYPTSPREYLACVAPCVVKAPTRGGTAITIVPYDPQRLQLLWDVEDFWGQRFLPLDLDKWSKDHSS